MVYFCLVSKEMLDSGLTEAVQHIVENYQGQLSGFENTQTAFEAQGSVKNQEQLKRITEELKRFNHRFKRDIELVPVYNLS